MSSNSRKIVYNALIKVSTQKGYSNIVFNNQIKNNTLKQIDVSLASAIFYGVLERRLTLDYIISLYSKIKIKKISTDVLEILRIGIYQIVFMDRIPDSAAVNESVKLVGNCKSKRGFVNAVLRAVVRDKGQINFPNKSILYSCPQWLVDCFFSWFDQKIANEILKSFIGRPDLTVRVNNLKINKQDLIKRLASKNIETLDLIDCFNTLKLKNSYSVENLEEFVQGLFHVQDLASQLCCDVLAPKEGEIVVDVCAAPGGKTFTMAQLMKNSGRIFAFDLHQSKLNLIKSGAKRLGISIIDVEKRDATEKYHKSDFADKILCDVPCSGLGIIKRKPEIRYKEKNWFESLPDVQFKILKESSRMLKVGGTLVYSTCTLNPKENQEVVDKFLSLNNNFSACLIKIPEGIVRSLEENNNQLTLIPGVNSSDGFFISCIRRLR